MSSVKSIILNIIQYHLIWYSIVNDRLYLTYFSPEIFNQKPELTNIQTNTQCEQDLSLYTWTLLLSKANQLIVKVELVFNFPPTGRQIPLTSQQLLIY